MGSPRVDHSHLPLETMVKIWSRGRGQCRIRTMVKGSLVPRLSPIFGARPQTCNTKKNGGKPGNEARSRVVSSISAVPLMYDVV